MQKKSLPIWFYIGAVTNIVFWAISWLQINPLSYVSFFFIWIGFILVVDGLNYRLKGDSLFSRSPRNFGFLFLISSFFWWVFELIVISTKNWYYISSLDISSVLLQQIVDTIFFSTLIPGIFEVAELIRNLNLLKKKNILRLIKLPKITDEAFLLFGILSLILPFIRPDIFFPLLWLGVFFLLDPINYYLKNDSLVRDSYSNNWYRIVVLSLAVLVCGFLWEFWNAYADPSWYYSVPYVGYFKIFEMPILGYLGYIPFAWEVFAFYTLLRSIFKAPAEDYFLLSGDIHELESNDDTFIRRLFAGRRALSVKTKVFIRAVVVGGILLILINIPFYVLKKVYLESSNEFIEYQVVQSNDVNLDHISGNIYKGGVVSCHYSFVPGYCLRTASNDLYLLTDNDENKIRVPLGDYGVIGEIVPPQNNIGLPELKVEAIWQVEN